MKDISIRFADKDQDGKQYRYKDVVKLDQKESNSFYRGCGEYIVFTLNDKFLDTFLYKSLGGLPDIEEFYQFIDNCLFHIKKTPDIKLWKCDGSASCFMNWQEIMFDKKPFIED